MKLAWQKSGTLSDDYLASSPDSNRDCKKNK